MSTFTKRIDASNNEGYKSGSTWYANTFNVGGNSPTYTTVFRFTNVTVPKGSTINSAKVTIKSTANYTLNFELKLYGIAEDNTGSMSSDPTGRTKTSAYVNWTKTGGFADETSYDTPDIKTLVQEITDRSGWSSGNAMGFFILDNGGTDFGANFYSYNDNSSYAALLTIEYTLPTHLTTKDLQYSIISPKSTTKSLRYDLIQIASSPIAFSGIKISKPGIDVELVDDPKALIFSSDYNTLKYSLSGNTSLAVSQAPYTDYSVSTSIDHNLGYFPVAFVYVKDNLMSNYQQLGRIQTGSGAYRQYSYTITTTKIYFIAKGWSGSSGESYTAYFYYKVFKNNLNL